MFKNGFKKYIKEISYEVFGLPMVLRIPFYSI